MNTIKRYKIRHEWYNREIDYLEVSDGQLVKIVGVNGQSLPISSAWTDDIVPFAIESGIWVPID